MQVLCRNILGQLCGPSLASPRSVNNSPWLWCFSRSAEYKRQKLRAICTSLEHTVAMNKHVLVAVVAVWALALQVRVSFRPLQSVARAIAYLWSVAGTRSGPGSHLSLSAEGWSRRMHLHQVAGELLQNKLLVYLHPNILQTG